MVSELSDLYWEFKPTGSNDVIARELMTDLHHMFTEMVCVPVYDREPQILDETFSALGFSGYEINFDREGICISNADQSWHNEEFYRHFISKLTPEMQKHLMKTDFGTTLPPRTIFICLRRSLSPVSMRSMLQRCMSFRTLPVIRTVSTEIWLAFSAVLNMPMRNW